MKAKLGPNFDQTWAIVVSNIFSFKRLSNIFSSNGSSLPPNPKYKSTKKSIMVKQNHRTIIKRNFLNPASSTKETFMDKCKNITRTTRHPPRSRTTRTFLQPWVSTKTSFVSELDKESSTIVKHSIWTTTTFPSHTTSLKKSDDTYVKDDKVVECENKKVTNKFIAKHVKRGSVCLVLDGKRVRTTRRLLKVGVAHVHIPNHNQQSYEAIKNYSNDKSNVTTEHTTLHTCIKSTKDRYDLIYMDTCGMFTTNAKYDLKETIRKCFYRNLLKEGGIFGVTITSRTNGTITDAKQHCDEWIVEQSGLMNVFTHSYGNMTTMFYK